MTRNNVGVGLCSGVEYGSRYFKEWRIAKARTHFLNESVAFIVVLGGLLNADGLNARFLGVMKKVKAERLKQTGKKGNPNRILGSDVTTADKIAFAEEVCREIAQKVLPPLTRADKKVVKYWVYPSPLLELKKDKKFGILKMIYDRLPSVSRQIHNLPRPYIKVCDNESI